MKWKGGYVVSHERSTVRGDESLVLFLFSTDARLAVPAVKNGVNYVIVDWERGAKASRQAGTSFQIGQDTVEDVRYLATTHQLPLFVRINPFGGRTESEIASALDAGAVGIMLPMARGPAEVSDFLALVPIGVKTLIQIETRELAGDPSSIADLPWDYVHVGLNDLMLSRGTSSIWTAVLDGTVEGICESLEGRSFGFGGMTLVDGGSPIPARLIMLEMARLRCSVGVLRRSFTYDVAGRDVGKELGSIRHLLDQGTQRSQEDLDRDRSALEHAIRDAGS